jgi:hypothetical protein
MVQVVLLIVQATQLRGDELNRFNHLGDLGVTNA